jgi:hypothetical protein
MLLENKSLDDAWAIYFSNLGSMHNVGNFLGLYKMGINTNLLQTVSNACDIPLCKIYK